MPNLQTLLLQISIIIVTSYSIGWLLSKFHQPRVVGEMVAGILLGPSLLGWVAPSLSAALFPPQSLSLLYGLSQVGLLLFMFLVGLELDIRQLRRLGHVAIVISHTSIIVPFLLGAWLAFHLYSRMADAGTSFSGFVLFMGAAMSVTAFPVLARILNERNLFGTRVGILTIACAAVDDVTAWCLLAAILAIVQSKLNHLPLWLMLAGFGLYLVVMLLVLRPIARNLFARHWANSASYNKAIAPLLLCMLASSLATEWLGIHALFGAFFAGVMMPKEKRFTETIREKFRPLVIYLLLPLFFAFTGLRTNIGLIRGSEMAAYFAMVFVVAVAGKFGGSTLAARLMGTPWREAAAIGILMNTRGLIELVILNIGLDVGILPRPLFSMMVLMAIGTTLMTTPLLSWVYTHPEAAPQFNISGKPSEVSLTNIE